MSNVEFVELQEHWDDVDYVLNVYDGITFIVSVEGEGLYDFTYENGDLRKHIDEKQPEEFDEEVLRKVKMFGAVCWCLVHDLDMESAPQPFYSGSS